MLETLRGCGSLAEACCHAGSTREGQVASLAGHVSTAGGVPFSISVHRLGFRVCITGLFLSWFLTFMFSPINTK